MGEGGGTRDDMRCDEVQTLRDKFLFKSICLLRETLNPINGSFNIFVSLFFAAQWTS